MFFGYKNLENAIDSNPQLEELAKQAIKTEINLCSPRPKCLGFDGENYAYVDNSKDNGIEAYKFMLDYKGNRYAWLDR